MYGTIVPHSCGKELNMEVIVGISNITVDICPDPRTQSYKVEIAYKLANGKTKHAKLTTKRLTFHIVFKPTRAPWIRCEAEPMAVSVIVITTVAVATGGYLIDLVYHYSNGATNSSNGHIDKFPFSINFHKSPLKDAV